jgi:hypothetical protein
MEAEYICDKCNIEMEIFDVGILASLEDECHVATKMICLCKNCMIEREKHLKKELQLIQNAIKIMRVEKLFRNK